MTIPGDGDFAQMPELLTVKQVARILQRRPDWVRQEIREGRLACVELGPRTRRVGRQQLATYLAGRTRSSAGSEAS